MQQPAAGRRLKKPNRTWVRPFAEGSGPLYLQIAQQVRDAVDDGVLQPGDRLPPQRDLAQLMGVDLTTVTRAYAELRQSDLLDAQGAGGTFIAMSAGNSATSVDLSMNIPPLLGSSPFAQSMERGFQQLSQQLGQGELMSYHVGAGSRDDRAAAVQWLAPILGNVSAERVVICPGAQAALCAIVLAKTQPGDLIAAEQLTYPGLLAAARVLHRGIVSIAMDAEGMLPDALEAACQQRKPALIYLIPTIQNPTTATMSQARRAAILAIARRHGIAVVEDDPYWLLAADAAPPLAVDSHADAPVYYVSTLSKCLAPGLRTAYLVVPPGEPMEPLLDALRSIALMPTQSMVAVASHWIRSGQADEMVRRFQQELRQRQQIAARILPKPYQAHPYGLHVWLPLPPRLDQYRLIQAAQAQGLGIASSEAFSIEEQAGNAIRLSLGGAVDQHSLAAALTKLTEVISAAPETRTQAIV
ncbi:PLP-dependent aminotransferase family protein [Stenotrophomonas sp.]|uniref:aminotransferase-like domain-containing protein n=1 Tax=Stenotrophomonas sp. TaxID=69392 RepID=UPI0028A81754|nr:PLP-dependent aminotransferase family protein [Stenotrophomonas sp.]